jgi:hypothetical protein
VTVRSMYGALSSVRCPSQNYRSRLNTSRLQRTGISTPHACFPARADPPHRQDHGQLANAVKALNWFVLKKHVTIINKPAAVFARRFAHNGRGIGDQHHPAEQRHLHGADSSAVVPSKQETIVLRS